MNTAFLSLYKVENLAPEIGDRIHLTFTGMPFVELQPEFSLNVPVGSELEFNRCLYQHDATTLPANISFNIGLSSQTLPLFTLPVVASYSENEDNDLIIEMVPTGFPPMSKVRLYFKKFARLKIANQDYFGELLGISNCLRLLMMWDSEIQSDNVANADFEELKNSLLQLYLKLNAIGQGLDFEDLQYLSSNTFANNFLNFMQRLEKVQKSLKCEKSFTKLQQLKQAYDEFIAKYNVLQNRLATMGITPCEPNTLPEDVWGPLDNDFRARLSCYCKMFALDGQLPSAIQSYLNTLKSKIDIINTQLNTFIQGQQNASLNPSSDNFSAIAVFDNYTGGSNYCEKVNDIANRLEWINYHRQYLVDVPPNTVKQLIESISNELKNLYAIFEELEFSLPGVCKEFDTKYNWKEAVIQSPYIYLQTCGADSSVDYAEGVHLRWSLLKDLAENHIPKGDLANTGSPYYANFGYNKENDYVKIEKIIYDDYAAASIDFANSTPKLITFNPPKNTYTWRYSKTNFTSITNRSFSNEIEIDFLDKPLYDMVKMTINPMTNPLDFLKTYNGVIEVSVLNKLVFAWKFELDNSNSGQGIVKYEAINLPDLTDFNSKRITIRKSASGSTFDESGFGENIASFRLKFEGGCFLSKINLETYNDFLCTRNGNDWNAVGDFGLTDSDSVAFQRLDDNGSITIDNNWPKFNNDAKVKIQNYKDKWTDIDGGLKNAVTNYLNLSKTDTKAYDLLSSDDDGDTSKLPFSYLDIVNLNGLDFHNARMLGLGHIDTANNTQRYVYLAVYRTHPLLKDNRGIAMQEHFYMSLPTQKEDLRLPLEPILDNVTYGLEGIDECTQSKMQKEGGYAKYDDVRFINIYRDKYHYEIPFEGFFAHTNEFNIAELALPIFYGIKYKEAAGSYVKPDLVNSEDYKDFNGSGSPNLINEVVLIIDTGAKLYTHLENNEGIHKYGIYGINWFSRTTPVSNEVETDQTVFTPITRTLPPSNIHSHYIQKEESLIFTTQSEQDALVARIQNDPNADNCHTRVTFNWNHLQQINYPDINQVEFFYKPELPKDVEGRVEKVVSIGNGLYDVYSTSFIIVSGNLPVTITPTLLQADYPKFIGSQLNCKQGSFVVDSIQSGTNGPVFRIKAEIKTENILNADGNSHTPLCVPIIPLKDSIFQVIENLVEESNWNKLDRTVTIVKHSTHSEEIDGVLYELAGIYGVAKVYPDPVTSPDTSIKGLFKIEFNTEVLADHPQKTNGVEWHKGSVRMSDTTGEIHELEVWAIDTVSPLVIWAYDPQFEPNNGYSYAFDTDTNINFHPGYKVYLQPESMNNFDKTTILPTSTEPKKENILGLRAINTNETPNVKSKISVPSLFLGLNIKEPIKPEKPFGPSFATRPDIYGKSTYSIDLKIIEKPFALYFYRATEFMLLSAIYDAGVIVDIYQQIELLETNEYDTNRFNDLANLVFDNENDENDKIQFKEFDGYRLPNTFKEAIETGEGTLQERIEIAINDVFIGLTLNPIVYDLVKTNSNLILTSSKEPVIKDNKGAELSKTNPLYEPYPFAIKYSENNEDYIRFTDYTLDGASADRYFYIVAEITREQKIGERSEALGPIKMVNSMPPEDPYIQKYETVLASPILEIPAGIRFYVNPYIALENVKQIAIYRTLEEKNTKNINLMTLACTIDIEESSNSLIDSFSDLDFPPFGKDIYYRIVALRKIKNEQDFDEYIPSKPSEVVICKVVDNINPPSPEISKTIGNTLTTPPAIENIVLEWDETCFEGKYTLYKMSDVGFWQLIKSFTFEDVLSYEYPFLNKIDEDGDTIYHRFKVVAENANGLLSLDEKILVI